MKKHFNLTIHTCRPETHTQFAPTLECYTAKHEECSHVLHIPSGCSPCDSWRHTSEHASPHDVAA